MNENMSGNAANGGENAKCVKAAKRQVNRVGFIRLKNNLFQAGEIKNLRLDGRSIRVFMTESLYARVEYEDEVKAKAIFDGVSKRLMGMPGIFLQECSEAMLKRERDDVVHGAEGSERIGLVGRLKKAWQR